MKDKRQKAEREREREKNVEACMTRISRVILKNLSQFSDCYDPVVVIVVVYTLAIMCVRSHNRTLLSIAADLIVYSLRLGCLNVQFV